jgi:hypothetical protein
MEYSYIKIRVTGFNGEVFNARARKNRPNIGML